MSLTSELNKARRKRLEEEEQELDQSAQLLYSKFNITPGGTTSAKDDIAPVKDTTEEDKRTWFQKGEFEDGYQLWDVFKTVRNTTEDLSENLAAGILGIGESVLDAGAYIAGGVGKLFGADEFADKTKEFIAQDIIDEKAIAKKLLDAQSPLARWGVDTEEGSVLGDKADALAQSAGQLAGTVALQSVGVPWFVTTGATSFGSEVENAFNHDATYGEAGLSGAISAGAEILTEKLSGGIKFGGKTLGDAWLQPLVNKISNKVARTAINLGLDALGEGGEEIISQIFSNLGSALYREEDLSEILASEEAFDEYWESFIGGAVLGGGSGGGKAILSIKTGRDYKSGLTSNEQKVVDKEVENRITEAESDGKKLKSKEKAKIEEDVLSDLKKGYISTDTIESVLGGESYKTYQNTITEEESAIKELEGLYEGAELEQAIKDITDNSKRNELKEQLGKEVSDLAIKGKDTYLSESYNEVTRKSQAFTADITKYDAKQQETIKKAVDSGILNDTRRTHEFVDMVAKISADKGVLFDFTNNTKLAESGFALNGKIVNGFVTKDGVTVNFDSAKSLNSIVGHEITHVLEGTEFYDALQETIFEYAKTKGEYKERLKNTWDLYKSIGGYEGVDGFKAIKREVVSDLVGDYLFTDADFINNLSVKHRNVFQKIYDEIKYLYKIATAGSKEARELERVKRAFEQAYKADSKADSEAEGNTKYSISEYTAEEKKAHNDAVLKHFGKTYKWAETGYLLLDGTKLDLSGKHDGAPGGYRTVDHRDITEALGYDYGGGDYSGSLIQFMSEGNIRIVPEINGINLSVKPTKAQEQALSDYISRYRGEVLLDIDDLKGNTIVSVEYPKGTYYKKILNDIQEWFDNGKQPETSGVSMFRSLTKDGETPKRHGNYNVYGEDVKLEKAPEAENIAPTPKAVDETVAEDVPNVAEDAAPMPENKATSPADLAAIANQARREHFHGAYTQDGKQYLSDGSFIAEFNTVDDSLEPSEDFPAKNAIAALDDVFLRQVNGNFDVHEADGGYVKVGDSIFDSKYINAVIKAFDNPKFTISKARGGNDALLITGDNGRATVMPVRAGDNVNIAYEAKAVTEDVPAAKRSLDSSDVEILPPAQAQMLNIMASNITSEARKNNIPLDKYYTATREVNAFQPTKSDTKKIVDALEPIVKQLGDETYNGYLEKIRSYIGNSEDIAPVGIYDEGAPIAEDKANALQSENIASLTDADVPSEMDAPYYGEAEETVADPFEKRDMKEVGNRKVKAYMYENPEVKPFFQEEANVMLGELQRSTKGERFYNDQLYYETNGEKGFFGTERETSGDIAYLLDECKYTYAEIEKGLKAIIEDNGAENNACSKRIEFLLNDRLLYGTTDFITGDEIPPNQDYIKLLNEKQIQEYSEEARKKNFDASDNLAPMPEVVEETAVAEESEDIAPTEQYEAIRPPRKKAEASEPRMKRADTNNNAPRGMEERSFVETATGSDAVDGVITPDDIPDEYRYYQVKSNKKSLEAANRIIANNSFEDARKHFNNRMLSEKITAEDMALGQRLIQEAAKAGDAKACLELTVDAAILGTEYGQVIQAMSMIRRLSPEGQLRALVRTVERGKARGDKVFEGVKVTKEMSQTILDTKKEDGTFDQNELNAAVEDVKRKIADQMGVTKLDKINAWRYLSMLGNPKTHLRNFVSNAAMYGTRAVKNVVARTVEDIALRNKKPDLNAEDIAPIATDTDAAKRTNANGQVGMFKNPKATRTKTWKHASDAVKAFAKETTKAEEANIKGDNKYSDEGSIKAKRQIFGNKVIDKIDKFNKDAMEWEDAIFSKIVYQQTLQEYLTANGVETEADIKNNPELVQQAKNYALEESRRATFRQDSFVAKKIGEIERKNPIYGMVIGSTMPFKTTPINVAKTGLAYSPLGFARNIYDAVQVKKGNMDASEAIDHVAQTFTGTSLALIGYALASLGVLNGAGSDDKEGKYDYQLGKQSYSFDFGGDTFSLSWLSPVAMPLFVGANAFETLVEQKEWDANVVFDTLAQTLDPLSEMSFLSSLDDVLSSYDSGIEKIMGMGESMVQNYVTQFVPTLSSQIASTFDDTKRSTKPSKNSGFTFGEETVNKVIYKIPGLRNTLEPTTDIWGNESKQTENFFLRGVESFFSPANKKADIYTEIDEEIKTLYGYTGEDGVIPSIPDNYVNYDRKKYEMSAEEHTAFKKTYGQTAYALLETLFDTDTYRNATFKERAEMVGKVYDYARDEARKEYFAGLDIEYTNAKADGEEYYRENPIKGAIEGDLPVDEYSFAEKYPEKYAFFKENGISYDTYKSADEDGKRAYTWAFENPDKIPLAKAVGGDIVTYRKYAGELYDIKADKDANGKSISGSRKEKVIEYINNMDADYGERIILFKTEYPSDNTYNYDIIDYLNSRDDISRDEMVTILKELGFIVHSNGTITW